MSLIRNSIETSLSVLFPGRCLACGTDLDTHQAKSCPVCNRCVTKLNYVKGRRCSLCSGRLISEASICTRCRDRIYNFESSFSLFEYGGIIKELIYQYKFEGRQSLSNLFGRLLGDTLFDLYPGLPIVPVPSSRKSRRKRGWDHITIIANKIHRERGIPVFNVLSRITDIPQKELNYAERLENLKGKILFQEKRAPALFTKAVLIDDVFTTGATCGECARILKENGVRSVYVVTLAID